MQVHKYRHVAMDQNRNHSPTMSKQADNQVEQIVQTVSNEYDEKQDAADRSQARDLAANWVEGSDEEKRLVRKLDWRILVSD